MELILMMEPNLNAFNYKTVADFDREAAEFDARKQKALSDQLLQAAQAKYYGAKADASLEGGDLPATVKIANEIQDALQNKDYDRANLLMTVHKALDKGILPYSATPQNITQASLPQQMQKGITAKDVPTSNFPQVSMADLMAPVARESNPMPTLTPQAMPGYGQAVGSIEAAKKGMGRQAEKNVDAVMNPQIAGGEANARLGQELNYANPIEKSKKEGSEAGARSSDLSERVADIPQLENTVKQLSELGKKATYTTSGQIVDFLRKEANLSPREGAVARTEYMSVIDNQILPLLRQTFGAQFTENEGKTLRATMGNPDKTPQEKDAALRSFIDQKYQTINSRQRQLGLPVTDFSNSNPISKYNQEDMAFKLRKSGYSQQQIDEYMMARGLK
jgi:hypothetical protein